ncbi:MAG: YARHG domain-containing protein [Anaerovoracaceae bacterium]
MKYGSSRQKSNMRTEKSSKEKLRKIVLGASICIGVAVLVIVGILLVKNGVIGGPKIPPIAECVGTWQEKGSKDVATHGGAKLVINKVKEDKISYSLGIYLGGGAYNGTQATKLSTTVDPKTHKGKVSFKDNGFGESGEGTISFQEDSVELVFALGSTGEPIEKADMETYTLYKISKQTDPTKAKKGDKKGEKKSKKENSDYVIPTSNTEEVISEDLEGLTAKDLKIARNEILARHGRMFNDQELQEYFNGKSWYEGTISPEDFDANSGQYINQTEQKNIDFIRKTEE